MGKSVNIIIGFLPLLCWGRSRVAMKRQECNGEVEWSDA